MGDEPPAPAERHVVAPAGAARGGDDGPPFVRIKIVSMGDAGVGKSCLIKRYCEEKFVTRYISTIGVDYGVKRIDLDGRLVKVNFWDLSGQAEFFDVRNEFYQQTQGSVLVFDVTNRASFESLEKWLVEANDHGAGQSITIVCGNKMDMRDVKRRAVSEREARQWATDRGLPYYETSALTGENVREMFAFLFKKVVARALAV